MPLSVRHVARLLDVSEKTVYRWVRDGKLPAYQVNEQYRFNRAELLEWATARRVPVSPELFVEPEQVGVPVPSLTEALRAGGTFYRVDGQDKREVLRRVVGLMPLPEEVDRGFLLDVLLARESVGSTGVGDGVAIPHVRNPIVLHLTRPMVTLCFLEQPIDFDAIDGKPVHTLFTIASPSVRAHLHLLSHLAWALRDPAVAQALAEPASRDVIMASVEAAEARLPER